MVANYTTDAAGLPGNLAFCVLCPQCRNHDTVTVVAIIVCHFIFKYLWLFFCEDIVRARRWQP